MRIHLSDAGTIALIEPFVFDRLDVLVEPQSPERLEKSIARVGRREGEQHLRLAHAVLRFLSGHAGQSEWEAKFEAMIAFAKGRGWVNQEGALRAHLTVSENHNAVSVDEFKAAMRTLPSGIAAVTTAAGDDMAGMIVSSLTSISADPPLLGFFAHESSSLHGLLTLSGRFVANVLGEVHSNVMSNFLSEPQGQARFKAARWTTSEQGQPLLEDALASLECDVISTQSLGSHYLVVGKIRKTRLASNRSAAQFPVVHFNATTRSLAPHPSYAE
jgi:flavin reductase (DIM6/NTAB) family NADH-FMN oxidoreductase RutF